MCIRDSDSAAAGAVPVSWPALQRPCSIPGMALAARKGLDRLRCANRWRATSTAAADWVGSTGSLELQPALRALGV
eukprot:7576633-Alexandrium_andersonii.AAC.1